MDDTAMTAAEAITSTTTPAPIHEHPFGTGTIGDIEGPPWYHVDFDEADMENIRSIAIFFGYLATALLLALTCVFVIVRQYRLRRSLYSSSSSSSSPPKDGDDKKKQAGREKEEKSNPPPPLPLIKILIFSLLAAASLATTWYYMYAFFEYSYQQWYVDQWVNYLFDGSWLSSLTESLLPSDVDVSSAGGDIPTAAADAAPTRPHITRLQLGPWLRDTSLFSQAWNAAMETDGRFWWSHQIFGLCWVWSLLFGRASSSSTRRIISGAWIFMLLGQIVAISFAMNLSFLAILVSPPKKEENGKKEKGKKTWSSSSPWVHHFLSLATFSSVLVIMYVRGMSRWELPALLTPHVLVFFPVTILPPPSKSTTGWLGSPRSVALSMVVLVAGLATMRLMEEGPTSEESGNPSGDIVEVLFRQVSTVFYEHPAVTSVSWDVVMCWTSLGMWSLIGENE